jgi:hypothetical protein
MPSFFPELYLHVFNRALLLKLLKPFGLLIWVNPKVIMVQLTKLCPAIAEEFHRRLIDPQELTFWRR